jgi:hypothetical protein
MGPRVEAERREVAGRHRAAGADTLAHRIGRKKAEGVFDIDRRAGEDHPAGRGKALLVETR